MPLPAIASIIHRITGVGLFVAMVFLMWALATSLDSSDGFDRVQASMSHPLAKLITWGIASFVIYHLFAGIKHLFMDAGYFETVETGTAASKAVIALSVVSILLVGVWIW